MKRLLCWIGIHAYGPADWQMVGLDSYYWFRRCTRCGHKRKMIGGGPMPRSRFRQRGDGVYIEERF